MHPTRLPTPPLAPLAREKHLRSRLTVLATAIALVLTGCGSDSSGPVPTPHDPAETLDASSADSVIVISIDTLRADRLSCYGYEQNTTPTLDRVAERGLLFEHCLAQSPWTVPSHATLLTGMWPAHHGVTKRGTRLRRKSPTLATVLGARGFATAAVVTTPYLGSAYGLNRGFDEHLLLPSDPKSGPDVTRAALEWVRARSSQRFFLFLHYYDVHSSYTPAPEYHAEFVAPYRGPANGSTAQLQNFNEGRLKLRRRDLRHASELYDAEIRELDDELARLFEGLREAGALDGTLLVITSDHGEEFGEHGGALHGRTLFEEVLHVPLVLSGPGVPVGRRSTQLATQADVVPTILARLGLPGREDSDGFDLLGAEPAQPRWVFAGAEHGGAQPDTLSMISDGRWKLVIDTEFNTRALYDLEQDPGESSNIADGHPERVSELENQLEAYLSQTRAGDVGGESVEERELLEALGY